MSNPRKRRLRDIDEMEDEIEPPPAKKAKVSNESTNITEIKSMFSNSDDHKEFMTYFKSIEMSRLSKQLSIPLDINRNVAEYATGTIQTCSNNKCKSEICVLNKDWNDSNRKWKHSTKTDKYYCQTCAPFTTRFIRCGIIQCVLNLKKCCEKSDDDEDQFRCYNYVSKMEIGSVKVINS